MILRGVDHNPAASHVKHTGDNRITRHEPNTPATTATLPDHSKTSPIPPLDIGEADGFVPVLNRRRNKATYKQNDKTETIVLTLSPQNPEHPTIIDLPTPRGTDDALPVTVNLMTPPTTTRTELDTFATFSELLNDRIQEAMLEVDRRAQAMEAQQDKYEAKIRSVHKRQAALQAKDEQRLTVRQSLLNQWEEKMTLRARDLAELERRATLDLAQREQDLATLNRRTKEVFEEHQRKIDNLNSQSELAIKAWHEVEITKYKAILMDQQSEYKARTEEFCEVQLQNLESNLDSYAEHARGIQEKLLVRMRKDIQQTFSEAHHDSTQPTTPIPDDADTPTPDQNRTVPMPTTTSAPGSGNRLAASTADRRWANVNYDDIMHPSSDSGGARTQLPSNTTTPHQTTPSKWADPDFQISQLRKTSTPARIRGRDRKSVTVFYNSFVDFLKIHQVPIKILDDVRIDRLEDEGETLYPMELHDLNLALHHRYSAAIYARLEEEDVLDPMEPLFVGLLQMFNSRRDGYALLKAILATTLMVHTQDIGSLSTPPTAQPGTTPYDFACSLNEFYRGQ